MSTTDYGCILEGMQEVLVLARANIKEPYVCDLLRIVDSYTCMILENREVQFEGFKEELLNSMPNCEKKQELVVSLIRKDQLKVFQFEQVSKYLVFFGEVLSLTRKELQINNYENAYKLVDSVHFLPNILLDYINWNKKRYWKNFVLEIGYNWSGDFLQRWERHFKPESLRARVWKNLKR